MKVAIPSAGEDLSANMDPRFGRCRNFLIVDTDTLEWRVVPNFASDMPEGAGIAAARQVVAEGAEVVLAGEVGANASEVLAGAGIPVYVGASGTVMDVLGMFETVQALDLSPEAADLSPEASEEGSDLMDPIHSGCRRDRGMGRAQRWGRRGRRRPRARSRQRDYHLGS